MLTLASRFVPPALMLVLAAAVSALWLKLDSEQARHFSTRLERDVALTEGARWRVVAEDEAGKLKNLRELAGACLERESGAMLEAAGRAAALSQAKTRARTTEEQQGVVDDDTRKNAIARLNRPL